MLRSSSELLGSELQALLSPYKSAACWRESPLLRSFEVKNSELWLQMGPASAVCGELALPSLEGEHTRLSLLEVAYAHVGKILRIGLAARARDRSPTPIKSVSKSNMTPDKATTKFFLLCLESVSLTTQTSFPSVGIYIIKKNLFRPNLSLEVIALQIHWEWELLLVYTALPHARRTRSARGCFLSAVLSVALWLFQVFFSEAVA